MVLSGVIWAFLDLTCDSNWAIECRSDTFSQNISYHSRHTVYPLCRCQLKRKTDGRCNGAERRANIISFSSRTHTGNQSLLWGWPEKQKATWKRRLVSKKASHVFSAPRWKWVSFAVFFRLKSHWTRIECNTATEKKWQFITTYVTYNTY